jgi:hypothetical protein
LADPEQVAQHYAGSAFEFESSRLTELCPVEVRHYKAHAGPVDPGWRACGRNDLLRPLPAEQGELWLDLVEQTGTTPEGLGASDHFLFVGRKVG